MRKTRKPKPISRYFEKPIPKPLPTFEKPTTKPKTDTDFKNRYRPSSNFGTSEEAELQKCPDSSWCDAWRHTGDNIFETSFPGMNVHCVVVSFPGTKVHGNETSTIHTSRHYSFSRVLNTSDHILCLCFRQRSLTWSVIRQNGSWTCCHVKVIFRLSEYFFCIFAGSGAVWLVICVPMGGAQSVAIPGGGSEGYHVLRVSRMAGCYFQCGRRWHGDIYQAILCVAASFSPNSP